MQKQHTSLCPNSLTKSLVTVVGSVTFENIKYIMIHCQKTLQRCLLRKVNLCYRTLKPLMFYLAHVSAYIIHKDVTVLGFSLHIKKRKLADRLEILDEIDKISVCQRIIKNTITLGECCCKPFTQIPAVYIYEPACDLTGFRFIQADLGLFFLSDHQHSLIGHK